jgi:XRE family transcriptional regulator, regulator of sulfur utilization
MTLLKQAAVGAWIRRLRTDQGLTLRKLATRTHFSPSFISQVENGVVSPSIASMEKIATVLGVTLGEFFAAAAQGDPALVVRAGSGLRMSSGWSQATIAALAPMSGHRLEPMLITLEPGGRSAKHPVVHPREEFGYVLAGEVALTLGPEEHALAAGDAVTLRPGELRRWENRGRATARVLIVASR